MTRKKKWKEKAIKIKGSFTWNQFRQVKSAKKAYSNNAFNKYTG